MKKLFLIFILALFFNAIWENLHSLLYVHYRGSEITEFILLRAALWDASVITILAVIFFKIKYLKNRQWLVIIFGIVIAVLLEVYALNTGRWAYNDFMPIIPLLNVGLTPTIQLGLLAYLSFRFVGPITVRNGASLKKEGI